MAIGMPIVATEATTWTPSGSSWSASSRPGPLGEAHSLVDGDEQGDGEIVGDGHQRQVELL